jgi:Bacterial Ig domain
MNDVSRFKHVRRSAFRIMIATGVASLVACGGGMGDTAGMTSTTPPTMTSAPPTVTLASPGATVNRTVALSASAASASGVLVTRVDFMVDGTVIGSAMTSPYTASWNTSTVTNGMRSLTAKVTDSAGMIATSAAVSVTVTNNPSFAFIQKLEGVATISGVRMPAGGPYLSQATINQVAAWISAGAPND